MTDAGNSQEARTKNGKVNQLLIDKLQVFTGRGATPEPGLYLPEMMTLAGWQSMGSISELFSGKTSPVPYTGFAKQLDELKEWADGTESGIAIIGGTAGAGKTRLAAQLCRWYCDKGEGYQAGFITYNPHQAERSANRLWVVDYAETVKTQMAELYQRLLVKPPDGGSNHILLIIRDSLPDGRSADARGLRLALKPSSDWGLNGWFQDSRVIILHENDLDVEARGRLFALAAQKFAEFCEPTAGKPDLPAEAPGYLGQPAYSRPLPILMAAYLGAIGEADILDHSSLAGPPHETTGRSNQDSPIDSLCKKILEHEQNYWSRDDGNRQPGSPALRRRAVALATFSSPPTEAAARQVLRTDTLFEGMEDAELEETVEWLKTLYPKPDSDPDTIWGHLVPDLLGEWLVQETLEWDTSCLKRILDASAELADAGSLMRTVDVLARIWAASRARGAAGKFSQMCEDLNEAWPQLVSKARELSHRPPDDESPVGDASLFDHLVPLLVATEEDLTTETLSGCVAELDDITVPNYQQSDFATRLLDITCERLNTDERAGTGKDWGTLGSTRLDLAERLFHLGDHSRSFQNFREAAYALRLALPKPVSDKIVASQKFWENRKARRGRLRVMRTGIDKDSLWPICHAYEQYSRFADVARNKTAHNYLSDDDINFYAEIAVALWLGCRDDTDDWDRHYTELLMNRSKASSIQSGVIDAEKAVRRAEELLDRVSEKGGELDEQDTLLKAMAYNNLSGRRTEQGQNGYTAAVEGMRGHQTLKDTGKRQYAISYVRALRNDYGRKLDASRGTLRPEKRVQALSDIFQNWQELYHSDRSCYLEYLQAKNDYDGVRTDTIDPSYFARLRTLIDTARRRYDKHADKMRHTKEALDYAKSLTEFIHATRVRLSKTPQVMIDLYEQEDLETQGYCKDLDDLLDRPVLRTHLTRSEPLTVANSLMEAAGWHAYKHEWERAASERKEADSIFQRLPPDVRNHYSRRIDKNKRALTRNERGEM